MIFTNKFNLPESVYQSITKDNYDGVKGGTDIISVTTLIQPPKLRMLKLRHSSEIEEDASENVWRLIGSAVHSVLENVDSSNKFVEERINIKVNDKIVSGKSDVYEDTGVLSDYKITSAWSIVYSPDGKIEWERQLNVLAYLFRSNGFIVERLQVVAILRDWNKRNVKTDSSYPQIPIVIVPIELWPEERQKKYIEDRVNLHKSMENEQDDAIPECDPSERWATENKWAIFKNENIRALKVHDSEESALEHQKMCDFNTRIEKREGEDKKCLDYCSVNKFCNYYKTKYGEQNEIKH